MALPHFILKLVFAFFIFLKAFDHSALASETENWSFEDHPHPSEAEHSTEELQLLQETYKDFESCINTLDMAYKIYQKRYPEFAKLADEPDMYYRWYENALFQEDAYLVCDTFLKEASLVSVYEAPEDSSQRIFYCGQYLNNDIPDKDQPVVEAIDFLVRLSQRPDLGAAVTLLSMNHIEHIAEDYEPSDYEDFPVKLNPDIDLALKLFVSTQKTYGVLDKKPFFSNLATPKSQLTPERIAFVEQAVKDGDLKRVFDTTPPCSPD